MIQLKSVTKQFGEFTAVDSIDLTINSGEVTALLGPNGAGKTTTMRLVTGYYIPDFGEILINGQKFDGEDPSIKNLIGYMPENNPLYFDLQVAEAFKLHGQLRGIPNLEERIEFVVKVTGLQTVYNRTIGELSKGYKQRVGLAIALLADPQVLILDEPTEGLDPNQRNEIRDLIKDLGKDKTVIISTHVLSEAEAMCDRIVIINQGKLVADGDKDSILALGKGKHVFKLGVIGTDIASSLSSLKSVTSVEKLSSHQDHQTYELIVTTNEGFLTEFHTAQIQNKWKLSLLKEEQSSLEDIFYSLTHNED